MSDADKATSRKSSPCGEDEGHPTPPPGPRLSGKDAQQLMAHTYYGLRWGLAALAFVFPLSLSVGAHWFNKDHDLPTSISGYYHTGMRNYFVATLVALGLFLILYKGFSNWESRLLNIAGVAAIGVAFLPTGRDRGATDLTTTFTAPQLHGICALATFSCVGAVAIFLGPATLDLITDARLRTMLWNAYRALGGLMILLPLACLFVSRTNDWSLFYTEWAAVWVFVAYWGVKTFEFRHNDAETKALQGELPRAGAAPNPGRASEPVTSPFDHSRLLGNNEDADTVTS